MPVSLSINDLITPASAAEWQSTILSNAATVQLKTTSWQEGSPTLTLIDIVSALMSQEDGLVSLLAQAGFLDFAATGTVTFTAGNGQPVTAAVTPDPSDPVANPTGALGWLDLLASSVYNVTRNVATFATGALAVGNMSASTYTYPAGTYHVENPTTGATYTNASAISIVPGTVLGTSITSVSNGAPVVVNTATAHGLTSGDAVVIAGLGGIGISGVFVVTVISATSFSLNGTDGTTLPAYTSGGQVRSTMAITISADLAGTGGTSPGGSITQPVTTNDGVYVSNPTDIIGSGFETNTALAARCRAKLASLSPNGPKGAYQYFALSAADILGNSANPLFVAPAVVIPTITRAAVSRDSTTGTVTTTIASASGAVGGVTNLLIVNVTAGTPIVVTTASPHGLSTGDVATIAGVIGAIAANGTWTITVTGATTFSLNGSIGGAAYTGGGVLEGGVLGQVDRVIQANCVPDTVTAQTVSAVELDVAIVATVQVPIAYAATYALAVQVALALFNSALPIGGRVTVAGTRVYPYADVIGVLYAAGIVGNAPSYVQNVTGLTLNGAATDLAFPSASHVASLVPTPVINVVGV